MQKFLRIIRLPISSTWAQAVSFYPNNWDRLLVANCSQLETCLAVTSNEGNVKWLKSGAIIISYLDYDRRLNCIACRT
ncbi:MAG: hypothetical protein Q8L02_02595 [Candidatus Nitrotoga sp.]|nr:hypothetical protein [Candidatus Nitrotoga sp.]